MSCSQYGMSHVPEYARATKMLQDINNEKAKRELQAILESALQKKDLALLVGVIQTGRRVAVETGLSESELPQIAEAQSKMAEIMRDSFLTAINTAPDRATAVLNRAIRQAEQFHLSYIPEYKQAKDYLARIPKLMVTLDLQKALDLGSNDAQYKKAINGAIDQHMQNDPLYKQVIEKFRLHKSYPENWNIVNVISRDVWKPEVLSQPLLKVFQKLMDMTFIKKYTRDRRGQAVPSGLTVQKVIEVQQPQNYLDYIARRDAIMRTLDQGPNFDRYNTMDARGVKTFKAQPSWTMVLGITSDPVNPTYNEYYMWHGTKPNAADLITSGDFRVDLAGSHAGSLIEVLTWKFES